MSFFSCSKEEALETSSEKKSKNLTREDFIKQHRGEAFMVVSDKDGNVLSYKIYDKNYLSSSANKNSRVSSTPYYVNPNASCNPFQTADNLAYFFNQTLALPTWLLPTNNFILDGERIGPGNTPLYVTGGLCNQMYNFLNGIASYAIPAHGTSFEEQNSFVVSFSDEAISMDPYGNPIYNHFNDSVTPDSFTFVREELACQILDTYQNDYQGDYLIQGVRDMYMDHSVSTGDLWYFDDRVLTCTVVLGRFVASGPF